MPSTKLLRLTLVGIAVLAAAVVAVTATPPKAGLPARQLAAESFVITTIPMDLPRTVQAALARKIGQRVLHMAAAGRPFNASDVVLDDSLPFHRLVCAAIGRKYVVVQFEKGGFSPQLHTMVFQRGFWRSYPVWSGWGTFVPEPSQFAAAIRNGTLWAAALRHPPS